MPLKKRLVAKRNITTAKIGMNLSSLFSIVKDSMTLNFFKIRRKDIGNIVSDILDSDKTFQLNYIDMSSLSSAETVSLAEKHLISPEFACDTLGRSLLLSVDEDISIMLCEEDHIRIQTVYPGLSLEEAFETALKIDEILENPEIGILVVTNNIYMNLEERVLLVARMDLHLSNPYLYS